MEHCVSDHTCHTGPNKLGAASGNSKTLKKRPIGANFVSKARSADSAKNATSSSSSSKLASKTKPAATASSEARKTASKAAPTPAAAKKQKESHKAEPEQSSQTSSDKENSVPNNVNKGDHTPDDDTLSSNGKQLKSAAPKISFLN